MASCPALHPIPEIHVASTVDFCIARGSGMQVTTTPNLKNEELCAPTALDLILNRQRWGFPPPSGVHPKEPVQSPSPVLGMEAKKMSPSLSHHLMSLLVFFVTLNNQDLLSFCVLYTVSKSQSLS